MESIMKVYGADICIDCRNYKAIVRKRGLVGSEQVSYVDITESTANLREFLAIRDKDPIFDAVKERGGIGIPLFVREDGVKTFELDEALAWIGQPPVEEDEIEEKMMACSIFGCK